MSYWGAQMVKGSVKRRVGSGLIWLGAAGVAGLLSACGGGGGGGGGGSSSASEASISSERNLANCVEQPTSTDVYDIDAYHACGDETGDLTGLWMVVADYQVTSTLGGSYEGQWRMTMRIAEEEGQLFAHTCKGFAFPASHNVTASIDDESEFTIEDPMSGAVIRLTAIDALNLEGEHESADSVPLTGTSVARSVVSARKLTDDAELPFGRFDIDYQIQGQSGQVDGQANKAPVTCMVQSLGETVQPGGSIPYSEITNVVAQIGSAASPSLVSASAGEAKPRPGETEPDFDFSAVEVVVDGDAMVGSSDPDQHEFEYLSNDRATIELVTTVDDGEEPRSFANTSATLDF